MPKTVLLFCSGTVKPMVLHVVTHNSANSRLGIKIQSADLHRPEERASLHPLLYSGYPDLEEKREGSKIDAVVCVLKSASIKWCPE